MYKLGLEGRVEMLWKSKDYPGRGVTCIDGWRKLITGSKKLFRWSLENGTWKYG